MVREWRPRDYQAPLLHRAGLVDAARRRDRSKREEMLQYITSPIRDEVCAASLIRLIPPSLDSRISLTLRKAAGDPSPLIRAAAMEPLALFPSEQNLQTLMAVGMRSDAQMGLAGKAEESLKRALGTSPENAAALFNMGLLRAEQNEWKEAEEYLRAALKSDPEMAQAAYNLCVLLSGERPGEAVGYCEEASRLRPDDPKHGYTLALVLHQTGQTAGAITRLKETVEQYPSYQDAKVLLQNIYPTAQSPSR